MRPLGYIIYYQALNEKHLYLDCPSLLSQKNTCPSSSQQLIPTLVLYISWTQFTLEHYYTNFLSLAWTWQELSIKIISLLFYFKQPILDPTSSSLHKQAYWNVNLHSLPSLCHSLFANTFWHLPPSKMSHRSYQEPPCNLEKYIMSLTYMISQRRLTQLNTPSKSPS